MSNQRALTDFGVFRRSDRRPANGLTTAVSPTNHSVSSELERHPGAKPIVDELEFVVFLVALLALEEVGQAGADVEEEVLRDGVRQGHRGVSVDLLEVDGAAVLLAPAVHARQASPADRRPGREAVTHRDVEPEPHDRDRQRLPGEVFGIPVPVAFQRRVEMDVRESDDAGQEPSGDSPRPLVGETDPIEIGVDRQMAGRLEFLAVVGDGLSIEEAAATQEVVQERDSNGVARREMKGDRRINRLGQTDVEIVVQPQTAAAVAILPDPDVSARTSDIGPERELEPRGIELEAGSFLDLLLVGAALTHSDRRFGPANLSARRHRPAQSERGDESTPDDQSPVVHGALSLPGTRRQYHDSGVG